MRALVVNPGPAFSVADVARGWTRGLAELGVDVRVFELDKLLDYFAYAYTDRDGEIVKTHTEEEAIQLAAGQIKAACYDWWPDVVVVISGFFMYPQLVEIMRARHRHRTMRTCRGSGRATRHGPGSSSGSTGRALT